MSEFTSEVHELDIDQMKSDILELTDAELETISGGNWFGRAVHWVVDHLKGPGHSN